MKTMTKSVVVLVLVGSVAACGSKNKNNAEEGGGGGTVDPNHTTGDPTDRSHEHFDPVKMDEVNHLLDRKRNIVSRCLSQAIDTGSAPKGSRGKIALSIVIDPSGKASSVEVIKTSIESKEVQGCVKRKVEEITFPQFPKEFHTSYTYAMEAN